MVKGGAGNFRTEGRWNGHWVKEGVDGQMFNDA